MRRIITLLSIIVLVSSCHLIRPNTCSPRHADRGVAGSRYYLKHGHGLGYKRWMRRNSEVDPVKIQQRNRFSK
jgi:hypothetical protein